MCWPEQPFERHLYIQKIVCFRGSARLLKDIWSNSRGVCCLSKELVGSGGCFPTDVLFRVTVIDWQGGLFENMISSKCTWGRYPSFRHTQIIPNHLVS